MATLRKRLLRVGAAVLAVACIALNLAAFFHARAMTHWSDEGTRTASPEQLSFAERVRTLAFGVRIPRPMNARTPAALGLDFTTHTFPNGRGDTLEAWHVDVPEAAVVTVVLHGYADDKSSMLDVAAAVVELGSSALLVDFYGSGGSTGTGTSLGVHEAADVRAAFDFCRAQWPERRVVLYGVSMGGAAILRAIAHAGVAPDAIALESTFDRLLTTVGHRFRAMGLPAKPLAELLLFWGGVNADIDGFAHEPVRDAAAVRCRALVLHGERDKRVRLAEARALFEALPEPKRFVSFTSGGHGRLLAIDAVRWRAAVEELFALVAEERR